MRRAMIVMAFALASALVSPRLMAEPSLEEKETARALFRKGDERYRAKDYAGALEAFRAADEIMGLPTTGLELGRTQIKLRQLVEARDTLLRVTRSPEDPNEADVQAEARAEAVQLAQQIATVIPTLKVEIRGPAADAVQIVLDGKTIAAAAIAAGVKVNPGIRQLRATAEGYITRERQIDVAESQERIVTMTLRVAPSEEEAEVVVDRDVGPRVAVKPASSDARTVAWISFGVAGAGLIVGAISGAMTLSKESDLQDACPDGACPPEQRDALDEATLLGAVSTSGFAIAAVGAAIGVTALVLATDGDDGLALSFGPGGVRLGGAF